MTLDCSCVPTEQGRRIQRRLNPSVILKGCIATLILLSGFGTIPKASAGPIFNPDNGHYYDWVHGFGYTWDLAKAGAESHSHLGEQGYLATITSQEEKDFLTAVFQTNNLHAFRLGGYQDPGQSDPAEGWHWVTGEAWDYTNWNAGEPNDSDEENNETTLEMYIQGNWNDINANRVHSNGYVIEYGLEKDPPATSETPEPASLTLLGMALAGLAGVGIRKKLLSRK